ncbi:MAG: ABC transporter ATP-binding protein [Acidobacteria bacterium]|nr:ABC transporter ATP-binding protein [Acidobacteriota bacterium]
MIEVRNLIKRFGDFVAVNGVSFDIREGESFALLGPNGSGKSTILKCLAGLATPTGGEIRVSGLDTQRKPRESRRLLSYLPQRVGFHDCLTAREVLEFYCRLRKLPSTRIDKVLHGSEFDFNGFCEKRVAELSGGMKQKLGLAVASLADAPILLLDEPTVSLDPAGAIAFRQFLKGLKAKGKTIVFTSHMLADVEALADRVAVLVDGKLVALESVEAIRQRTKDRNETIEEVYLDYAKAN